jgi:germination protein M
MASKKSSRTRSGPPPRHRGLGFLFWLCLAGIAVAVAVAAREPLRAAVQELGGGKPSATKPAPKEQPKVTVAPLSDTEQRQKSAPQASPSTPASPVVVTSVPVVPAPAATAAPSARGQPAQQQEKAVVRKARLYFTTIDQSGRIQLKSVIRPIAASDSPLRDTLESLLKGPTSQELNLGYVSMIPVEARLRGVTVKGDTAVIDFSQSFRFNPQGLEAMDAQLRQVVFAATEFPSVRNVQIQIEGSTVRYLGTEGMRLDVPLSRASFQN